MLVPGWLLAGALRIEHNRLLLSIAFSVAISTLNLALVRVIGIEYSWALSFSAIESVLLLFIALRLNPPVSLLRGIVTDRYAGRVLLMVVLAVGAYAALAGPYLEVPADNWWHLAKIKDAIILLGQPPRGDVSWDGLLNAPNLYGYYVPSLAASLWDFPVVEVMKPLNVINSVLFCVAIYTFASYLFERSEMGPRHRAWYAAAAVMFFVLQFGVNVFSFMRYYVYAPAFINYLLYLSAAALLIEYYRTGSWRAGLPVFGLVFVVAYLIHKQEAMFIILMTSLLIVVEFFRSHRSPSDPNRVMAAALFSAVLAAWAALWIASYTELPRSNPLAYNTILPLEQLLPFFRNLYVADPTFQFYEVLAVWGIVVYALFFSALFRGERLPGFLVAGMLVPFVTIFNPFFVDLFLRHNYPDVIWRACYMIPLPFIGAWLFTRALYGLMSRGDRWVRFGVANALVAVALIVFLFPISTTFFESRYSRLYTVLPVTTDVDHDQWQDMFDFLDSIGRETVITDQVTGYMVNALTPHYYRGHKFYGFGAPKIRRKQYDTDMYSQYEGSLIVVNRRDGGLSRTGRLSGHWPETILKVSRFYPRGFLAHIEANPQKYRKIWERSDIQVYEIQS
jgi:hypothetical protein